MKCLERYRSGLLRGINRNLRDLMLSPGETAIHDFRVGVKRLTALYYFLAEIDTGIEAKMILKPGRRLFKRVSTIRDAQIAAQLIQDLEPIDARVQKSLLAEIDARIKQDYRGFLDYVATRSTLSVRVPTISALGLSQRAILRHRPVAADALLRQFFSREGNMTAERWHRKRILLKRYRHNQDAFAFCPGPAADEGELKQIRMLEQLLGDWHDRVTSVALLNSLHCQQVAVATAIAALRKEQRLLLGSAKIYLDQFQRWHLAR